MPEDLELTPEIANKLALQLKIFAQGHLPSRSLGSSPDLSSTHPPIYLANDTSHSYMNVKTNKNEGIDKPSARAQPRSAPTHASEEENPGSHAHTRTQGEPDIPSPYGDQEGSPYQETDHPTNTEDGTPLSSAPAPHGADALLTAVEGAARIPTRRDWAFRGKQRPDIKGRSTAPDECDLGPGAFEWAVHQGWRGDEAWFRRNVAFALDWHRS